MSQPASSTPDNAFSERYLDALRDRDEDSSGLEAASAGPHKLLELPEGFGIFRLWESPEKGHKPLAVFRERGVALRFLAVWNLVGQDRAFKTPGEAGPQGVPVESGGETVGRLQTFNDELLFAAHVVDSLLRSPAALAVVLGAAGPAAQEIAGQILALSVSEGPADVAGR
ncbi:MAG TPA: hypothetical protein VLQ45_08865 [Thermoanaerobaculia bacterium]|nr:hypothetical protein [Thermoanaerobaculia bacterium]